MKKTMIVSLLFICIVSLCYFFYTKTIKQPGQVEHTSESTINVVTTENETSESIVTTKKTATETQKNGEKGALQYIPGSIKIASDESVQTWDLYRFIPTHREIYYLMTGQFIELVSDEEYDKWEETREVRKDLSIEPEEMFLVSFVKYFNIPRSTFEEAANRQKQFYLEREWDIYDEAYEIPNADVIYTFDNEIISEYYRRE